MSGERTTREIINFRFAGDGIVDGEIDAKTLASTLGAAVDLVQAVREVDYFNGHAAPELKVVATAEGSFELVAVLEALGEWWASVRPILICEDSAALVNLGFYVTVVMGALKFLKKRGRRRIKVVRAAVEGDAEVELEDGDVLRAPSEVVAAAENPHVQSAAKSLVSSAFPRGVQSMTIEARTVNVHFHIDSSQAENFPDPSDSVPTAAGETYVAWATFTRPDFGGSKWRMESTKGARQVIIQDEEFLGRVARGDVSLNKYSEFRVEVREEPYVTQSGQTRFRRLVTKVLESREGANVEQATLKAKFLE